MKKYLVIFGALVTVLVLGVGPAAAAQPGLSVSPRSLDFGQVIVGASVPNFATVTITNNSDATEHISTYSTSDPAFQDTQSGTCFDLAHQRDIGPGKSCTDIWSFLPSSAGKFRGFGTIIFESGATVKMRLTGEGIQPTGPLP